MSDLDLLTEVHTDVKYIRKNLQDHIDYCEKQRVTIITPLWEKHQQDIGAKRTKKMAGFVGNAVATLAIAFAGTWAAIRGLK